MSNKFYLSTAIAYTNAKPHLGHALEFVVADVIARYYRLKGVDTYFLTGTDEHGSKIYKVANDKGVSAQDLVDENSAYFLDMTKKLNLSQDQFIRTTSEIHKKGAEAIWNGLIESGDIYLNKYSGLYCSGCEAFMAEKDLIEGKCAIHLVEPELVEEENYFFRLSKYSEQIGQLIESDELKIYPSFRKNEILNLVKEGLLDVSFSRPKSVLPWGISVPNSEEQVMYVWCDALTNYISALGYPDDLNGLVAKYWPCDLHIIGKDILRFHAGVWIGMLLSVGLTLPKAIGVHGFVTSEGRKMSKSLGNVVDPDDLLSEYPVDAIRYYLIREIPTGDDGDFSRERFKIVYDSDLANNFGNLASRTVSMVHKYFEGIVPQLIDFKFEVEFQKMFEMYEKNMEQFDSKKAVEVVLQFLTVLNQFIEEQKPWALAKEGRNLELVEVMANLVEGLRRSCYLMYPIIPVTIESLAELMGIDLSLNFKQAFDFKVNGLPGKKLQVLTPLFPRLS